MAGSPTHPFPFKALQALHLPGGLLADVGKRQWMQPTMMHAQPLAHKRITRARLTHGLCHFRMAYAARPARVADAVGLPGSRTDMRSSDIAQTCQTCAISDSVVCGILTRFNLLFGVACGRFTP